MTSTTGPTSSGGLPLPANKPPTSHDQPEVFTPTFASKIIGLLIISTTLVALFVPLKQTLDTTSSNVSGNAPSPLLMQATLIASLLNSVSHTAVILSLLQDTLVISILIGVSFDVLSRILYVLLWLYLRRHSNILLSPLFMTIYTVFATYHFIVHLRALAMTRSFRRLESVVRSAYNNIVGNPGSYCLDHVFAFSDTGFHIFHLGVSMRFLGMAKSLLICCGVTTLMTVGVVGTYCHCTRAGNRGGNGNKKNPGNVDTNLLDREGDLPICRCSACRCPGGVNTAFCIRLEGPNISVCNLWQSSFRQVLSDINVCDERAMKRKE